PKGRSRRNGEAGWRGWWRRDAVGYRLACGFVLSDPVGLGDGNVVSAAVRMVGVFSVAFELVAISGSLSLRIWRSSTRLLEMALLSKLGSMVLRNRSTTTGRPKRHGTHLAGC